MQSCNSHLFLCSCPTFQGYGFRVVYRGLENSCVIDKLQRNTCYKFRVSVCREKKIIVESAIKNLIIFVCIVLKSCSCTDVTVEVLTLFATCIYAGVNTVGTQ